MIPSKAQVQIRRANAPDAALLSSLNQDVHAVHVQGMPDHFKPTNPGTFPSPSEQTCSRNRRR